jgi:hypothetical protein
MSEENLMSHAKWKPASGHAGGWRVVRQFFPPLEPPEGGSPFEEACGPSGRLRLFRTIEAAQKAADALNGLDDKPSVPKRVQRILDRCEAGEVLCVTRSETHLGRSAYPRFFVTPEGRPVSIRAMGAALRKARANPDVEFKGWNWFPTEGRHVVRDFRIGLDDRINMRAERASQEAAE